MKVGQFLVKVDPAKPSQAEVVSEAFFGHRLEKADGSVNRSRLFKSLSSWLDNLAKTFDNAPVPFWRPVNKARVS